MQLRLNIALQIYSDLQSSNSIPKIVEHINKNIATENEISKCNWTYVDYYNDDDVVLISDYGIEKERFGPMGYGRVCYIYTFLDLDFDRLKDIVQHLRIYEMCVGDIKIDPLCCHKHDNYKLTYSSHIHYEEGEKFSFGGDDKTSNLKITQELIETVTLKKFNEILWQIESERNSQFEHRDEIWFVKNLIRLEDIMNSRDGKLVNSIMECVL